MALSGVYQTPDEIIAGNAVPATSFNKYGNSIIYLASQIPVTLLTTRGDLLTRDGTGMARLGIGVAGRYLRSNGTDPSWSALAASDLTYSGLTAGQYLRASGATAAAFASLQFADLTYSGLTAGNVLRATGATSAAFGAIAAGDLPTATTAAQGAVRIGNDLAITSTVLNLNKGTSFPVSPAAGDTFIRTDRNYRKYTYDGTRWLGDPYALPFAAYTNLQPTTVSGNAPFLFPMPPDCDLYLHAFRCQMNYILAPNDGSNYWTITLRIEGASVVSIASFTTAAMSAATYTQQSSTVTSFSTNPVTQGAKTISIAVTKTGSPGGLYVTPYLRVSDIG